MPDDPLGKLMEMPRNPARAPGPLEQLIADMTVNPIWDVAKGVGAIASGHGNAPEVGAGLMAGIGMMGPGRMPVLAAEKGLGSGAAIPLSKRLEDAMLKDSGVNFPAVYEEFKALPVSEIKSVAKEFMGGGSFSSGTEALKKVWSRHMQLELMRAKSRAVGGRSAG